MRHYLMILVAVLVTMPCWAQGNKIYIEDFEIEPDSSITVPVMMANADSTRGVQFNLTLPQGLALSEFVISSYSHSYEMTMTCRLTDDGNHYVVMVYPNGPICFPAGTASIVLMTFTASSNFKGGIINVWKCRGSTIDNHVIEFEGGNTTVTVPASSLIGVPIDKEPVKDEFFNLQGAPISSPDSVSLAIKVSTWPDGKTTASKVACRM